MARKPRVESPGVLYHVLSRGNRKQPVFGEDRDRDRFLGKLADYKKRYGFVLYAYALMDNHIHLLLETVGHPLSKIMQGLLQSHTQYHNRKYGTVGHVFQGRYKAIVCEKDAYLLQLVRYIHLNPVRSGLVRDPAKYRWSSHNTYLGTKVDDLIDTDPVLSRFAQMRRAAVRIYRGFVLEGIGDGRRSEYYELTDQRFLGSEEFVERIARETGARDVADTSPRKTLDQIAQEVERATGVTAAQLRGRGRGPGVRDGRLLFVRLSLDQTNAQRKQIAAYLDREPAWASCVCRKLAESV